MNKVSFALVIHSHQPVGNFDHVIEEAYQKSYAPFLRALEKHPRIRLNLHYSGILLEWLEKRHPEFFDSLHALTARGQVELFGGGYYEPILPIIPDGDKVAQIRRLADYVRVHFGAAAKGAWVAERVWEPALAKPLSEAGVDYVILDDTHFLASGLEPWQLRGVYVTEELGAALRLIPSLKSLRYAIPFREPAETLSILREGIYQSGSLFAMGDDCEKFGVWPGTYEHCYTNGWLERFFQAIESAGDWLETTTLADYLGLHLPLGRVYLPTASYAEMMEWALPTSAARELRVVLEESEHLPNGERFRRFLRGGLWRNFLTKYPEVNQLQKLMLEVSRRWHAVNLDVPAGVEAQKRLAEAQTHLLAGQCNDAYWHGVFGGQYAPHLRSALLRNLVQAEVLLDQITDERKPACVKARVADFDTDGRDEILIEHPTFGLIMRPADGGTASSLRFKPARVELVNSLRRRPEAYHDLVRRQVETKQGPQQGPTSIHDRVLSKESNLDTLLRYDRFARHSFRTYLFPAWRQWDDFYKLGLQEHEDLAEGPWQVQLPSKADTVHLQREASLLTEGCYLRFTAAKTIVTKATGDAWHLECRSGLTSDGTCATQMALGLEMVLNLLAPEAPDRYFQVEDDRHSLEFKGELVGSRLSLVDEWQRVRIVLEGQPEPRWWITPIETISQSESGFERVYQGSAILVVWRIDPPAWRNVTCALRADITHLDRETKPPVRRSRS